MMKLTGNSNNEANFWHKLIANTQVSRHHSVFANNLSADKKITENSTV